MRVKATLKMKATPPNKTDWKHSDYPTLQDKVVYGVFDTIKIKDNRGNSINIQETADATFTCGSFPTPHMDYPFWYFVEEMIINNIEYTVTGVDINRTQYVFKLNSKIGMVIT